MKETIEALVVLQDRDRKMLKYMREARDIPARKELIEGQLADSKAALADAEERQKENTASQKTLEVEIDSETGTVKVLRYIAVEDVGTVLNPLLLDGQIHGGIVQGAGHVLGEEVRFGEDGQVLSGSFMDYTMPRADDVPFFEIETNSVPTERNPLGVKGAGEAGTVGAVACLTSAILDALAPLGITDLPMPATPERLWRTINDAKDRSPTT